MITNPILPGFNPDPSIIRVEDDYYIAISTFEWFPGVQIHHSRDLIHWKLVARPLNRVSQLNMKGDPNSGGIWAPCLTYDDGVFYLIYTDVKSHSGIFKDTHNYMVTASDICGEWSEPIYLNSSGFDPSLFHDDDGRKWLVNMTWEFRKGRSRFGGIVLQEYCPKEKKLMGPVTNIFKGSEIGVTEGPHIYKRKGYYYLLTAEGGTSLGHSVTVARSRNIAGPYEIDPENPILTSSDGPTLELQKAGHADIVETQNGEWYMVHLCGRPIPRRGRCILGRETSIQKVEWTEEGWLRLSEGGHHPKVKVPAPELQECPWEKEPVRDHFDSEILNIHFQTLRTPLGEEALSLTERPGYLRLKGGESPSSMFNQTLVGRRLQAFRCEASTCVEFVPESFKNMAGLSCFYSTECFYYLYISQDEEKGKILGMLACNRGSFTYPLEEEICIEGTDQCYLKAEVNYDRLQFYYAKEVSDWIPVGPVLDTSILSDENASSGGFTGAFFTLSCQDLSGNRKHADFDWFEYREK